MGSAAVGKTSRVVVRPFSSGPFSRNRRLSAIVAVSALVFSLTTALPATAAVVQPATGRAAPAPETPEQPDNLATLEDGYGATPAQKQAMARAETQATSTGKAVVVDELTTETTEAVANPGGGFTLSTNAKPVRARQGAQWVPVNTALHPNRDHTLSPSATAYGTVVFSGGGRTPLASTTAGHTRYTVSWPGVLPAPRVSGSSATYPEVLPGVDLRVTATVTGGFSDVLVVKNATAAKNPALATLTLPATVTGGRVASGTDGGITVTGGPDGSTLDASTPMMWDSNTSLTAAPTPSSKSLPDKGLAPDPSDASHPGMAARVAPIKTHVTTDALTLSPDKRLLSDPATTFPVYLDPSFNWHPASGGTPAFDEVKQGAPCANTSFFGNPGPDGDYGFLGVGFNNWNSCVGVERTYYQWQLPSVIWGAHIGNAGNQHGATVNVSKAYSASCSVQSNDYLHWTGAIGPGTSWNNQPGPAGVIAQVTMGAAYNPTYCPNNGAVAAGFDVTAQIAQSAASHASQFTVGLSGNETPGNVEFSRFTDNPSLQIFFNLIPNTPGPLAALSGSANLGCATTTPYPYLGKTIVTNPPVLNATVSDPDADQLRATFKYWIDGSSSVQTGLSADNLDSGAAAKFSLPPSFTAGLSNGQVVDWQVQATDGQDWSPWSQICHFIAEPTAPSEPSITSADGAFPDNGTIGKPANTPGLFTEASTGGTVSKLVTALDRAPSTNNPPATDIAPFDGGGVIKPASRWKLADGSGTAAADSAGNANATLHGGTSWLNNSARGQVLGLDGSSGYASSNGPVVKTDGSFTVSAWVDLTSNAGYQTFVAQQGTTVSGFYLEYDSDVNQWTFARFAGDSSTSTAYRVRASTAVTLNTWTHLAGTYDAATGTMTIYVNGVAAGSAIDSTPWNATGPVVIGRGFVDSGPNNYVHGAISDVQLYQATLSTKDIERVVQAGGQIEPVGRWRFLDGTGTSAADSSSAGHPATLTGGYNWTTTPTPAVTFNGSTGYAATSAPVVDTSHSFSVSAWVKLSSTANYATAVSQGGNSIAAFYLQYNKNLNAWAFVLPSADSATAAQSIAKSAGAPTLNAWTHLVGVFNTTSAAVTLYVNGQVAGTTTDSTPWNATGPTSIGAAKLAGGAVSNSFTGSVTDVQIYTTALGAAEVGQLFASSTGAIKAPGPGPHTIYSYAADPAGDASGYQSYRFVAANDPNIHCASLAACYNNTGISPDSNHALGNLDGDGSSFSATDLTNAGWLSGGRLTVNGGTYMLPSYGAGQADNVLAANQIIDKTDPVLANYNATASASGASSLQFLTTGTEAITATPGAINGDSTSPFVPAGIAVAGTYCFDSTNPAAFCAPKGVVTYNDGSTSTYYLTVPDWVSGPEDIDVASFPHKNLSSGQANKTTKIYSFSVPLSPGKTITSVTLPDVGNQAIHGTAGLHVFALATRNTTTAGAPAGQTWTGAWASPNELQYNFSGSDNFSNQTIRLALKPSLSGNSVRVKLDNALGTNPLQIGHATIALGTADRLGEATPTPSGPVVALTFNGSTNTSIPEGGMVYSDALTFTVAANQYLLVSFQLVNQVPYLVENVSYSNEVMEFMSAVGSGDHTADTTDAAFAFSTPGTRWGAWTNIITDLDVATANVPTQALFGDTGLIDTFQPNTNPDAGSDKLLADDIAAAEPTTVTPYGTIAENIESNSVLSDNASVYGTGPSGGPSALARIDRDLLDQPGVNTVVLSEGLEDVLHNHSADELTIDGYDQLVNYFTAYGINIVVMGLTPCDGYAGSGGTPNDPCTSAVDQERTQTNTLLSGGLSAGLGPWSTPSLYYIDSDAAVGEPDPVNGAIRLKNTVNLNHGGTSPDYVNINDNGFGALTSAYLGPQDRWQLNDGATDSAATLAGDSANNATNPHLINNPNTGNNPLTLTGGTTWVTDSKRGTTLSFDGTTGYAATGGPVLDTTKSYSISGWVAVDRAGGATSPETAIAVNGTQNSALTLGYNPVNSRFQLTAANADSSDATIVQIEPATSSTDTWVHLTATFNATNRLLSFYINGSPMGTQTLGSPWNASGPLSIGSARQAYFFDGMISDVRVWDYALAPAQVTALYQNVS